MTKEYEYQRYIANSLDDIDTKMAKGGGRVRSGWQILAIDIDARSLSGIVIWERDIPDKVTSDEGDVGDVNE